ncbi:MAG: histidine phosphatase family protein [Deltaproteobacteria bacterium]|nr:MAG: histidine phosphatase family protein [Deltaproteobacteria bacterium]
MKRRLILMRHAKSSWKGPEPDHERPLNPRGRRDAPRVARELCALGWEPELVLLSDSRRTTETWQRMSRWFSTEPQVVPRRSLYLSGFGAVQHELMGLPERASTALVLGHNPDWESAVSFLVGEPVRMTTANAALLEFPPVESWEHAVARPSQARLITVIRPKELGPAD